MTPTSSSYSEHHTALEATFDRFDGEHAVITTRDGQILRAPRTAVPHSITHGTVLWIVMQTHPEREADHHAMAKALLNEMLHPGDIT